MRIEDARDRFLLQLEADGRSEHTRRQYRRHVTLMARWAADVGAYRDVSELDHEAVAAFLASDAARTGAHGATKKATSMNCLRSSVKGFLGYLHRAGHIATDPGRLVRQAVCAGAPPRGLSDAERERLLRVLDRGADDRGRRDRTLFRLILETGIRLSSAVELDVEHVDLEAGEILLLKAKGDRQEKVYLPDSVKAELAKFIGERESGPLFTRRSGERITSRHAQRRFSQIAEKAKLRRPVSPHHLRHDFATRLYNKTGDLLLVKEALHHRSIASTLVYARPDEGRLRRAMG